MKLECFRLGPERPYGSKAIFEKDLQSLPAIGNMVMDITASLTLEITDYHIDHNKMTIEVEFAILNDTRIRELCDYIGFTQDIVDGSFIPSELYFEGGL